MYKNIYLSASIMCVNWLDTASDFNNLSEINELDFYHYDVVDGIFAPDFTMGSSIINNINSDVSLPSDYHLMVDEPKRIFEMFNIKKSDMLTIHQESSRNLHRDLVNIRKLGAKVGVALSPSTTLDVLEYIIEDIDLVILMTVNPGFKGQKFIPQVLNKINKLNSLKISNNLNFKISVDGNVNDNTIPEIVAAGADILVLGSSGLFIKEKSMNESMQKIKSAIDKGLK
tara:strand:- start:483 stop:1166 length:684 start_codon:yes stop_codon:yes gene_type:complete